MDDKLLEGVSDQVREMVDELYPALVREAQTFLAQYDLRDEETRKDVLFALLFSCGMVMGRAEGAAVQLGVSPQVLFTMTPKILANGRTTPLRPEQ
jgi:hypothetical protein